MRKKAKKKTASAQAPKPKGTEGTDVRAKVEPKGTEGTDVRKGQEKKK